MKTTLDLPDALVREIKLHARNKRQNLKDAAAELLRKGLAAAAEPEPDLCLSVVGTDKKTGLPLIQCKHAASPDEEFTPERIADILLAQDIGWHHAAGR